MNNFIFPENANQLKYLKEFYKVVFDKYTYYKNNFMTKKNKNSTYERLCNTSKRGKGASIELISDIVKQCKLPQMDSTHYLGLLYQLQHTACVRHKDDIYFVVGDEAYFKEFKICNTADEGMAFYLDVIKKVIEADTQEKENKIESILCLLGSMDLNRTEVMKIIHFLAHNFK
jgi:hypothetical protein